MRRTRSSYALASPMNGNAAFQSHADVPSYKYNRSIQSPMAAVPLLQASTWTWPTPSNASSRSSTPRASWPSSPTPADGRGPRRNPWPMSPHSPPSESRSPTPLAPQPIRPILAPPRTPQTPFPSLPPSPVSSEYQAATQSTARNREMLGPTELSQLILTPSFVSELRLCFPSLLSKQPWDSATSSMCYVWALKNPKTALLLYMTENLASWPLAAIFDPLTDEMIPFKAYEVDRAVGPHAAEAVVQMQRKVCVCTLTEEKHVDVKNWEDLPLRSLGSLGPEKQGGSGKVDKVQWMFDKEDRVQVRKTISISDDSHRAILEKELASFRKLSHPGIVKITASYLQENTLGILMSPIASYDLAEYLSFPQGTIQAQLLRKWIKELVSTLDYLHSKGFRHQGIRPRKILVSGESVVFSSFGLSQGITEQGSADGHSSRLSGDKYDFAAPEKIHRNKSLRSADIFSLGCVLAELMTAMKQQTTDQFRTYRTTDRDSSFGTNRGKVLTWLEGLAAVQRGSTTQEMAEDAQAISFIKPMLQAEPAKRPKTGILVASFGAIWRKGDSHAKFRGDLFW